MVFFRCFRLLLLLGFFFALSSCTVRYAPSKTTEDYSQETIRLEKRIAEERDASVQARAKEHLELAWLHLDYRNPRADYGGALKEFEAYLTLASDGEKKDEIQNWISILRKLESLKKQNMQLQEQILYITKQMGEGRETLEQQVRMNIKLEENMQKLQESNTRLKDTIRQLQTLDRQMEERRRSIK